VLQSNGQFGQISVKVRDLSGVSFQPSAFGEENLSIYKIFLISKACHIRYHHLLASRLYKLIESAGYGCAGNQKEEHHPAAPLFDLLNRYCTSLNRRPIASN
jgi:hypothetical protein